MNFSGTILVTLDKMVYSGTRASFLVQLASFVGPQLSKVYSGDMNQSADYEYLP